MDFWNEDHIAVHSRFVFQRDMIAYCSISMFLVLQGCIEPFNQDNIENPKVLSIEGSIIKGDSIQVVRVFRTASLSYPEPSYVEGCEVKVVDELNNEFSYHDDKLGIYSAVIPDEALVIDRDYKLVILTPDGHSYESEYESFYRNSEVDSVYYEIEQKAGTYTDIDYWGLQYYVDIAAPDNHSRYYRWKLTETYEYTSIGPISYIYMVIRLRVEKIIPDDIWEVYRCWISERVPGTYVTNTMNLTVNEKKRIPLNFVSNRTDRLKIMYSLLVEQYAISEGAYKYWKQNNIVINESSGLYTSQPGEPITNIYCTDDCEERVIGYFWVSSKTERRIFTPRINELKVYDFNCRIFEYDPEKHLIMPRYIMIDSGTGLEMTGVSTCFDCTKRKGKNIKPDFWIR